MEIMTVQTKMVQRLPNYSVFKEHEISLTHVAVQTINLTYGKILVYINRPINDANENATT